MYVIYICIHIILLRVLISFIKYVLGIFIFILRFFFLSLESEAEAWLSVLRDFCESSRRRSGPPGMDLLSNSNMEGNNERHVILNYKKITLFDINVQITLYSNSGFRI